MSVSGYTVLDLLFLCTENFDIQVLGSSPRGRAVKGEL